MDYCIVTSIFDIKRLYPGLNRWRSTERYIKLFEYINSLEQLTILFIEPHLRDRIKLRDNLYIIEHKLEELPTYIKIKNLVELQHVSNGSHVNKEFTAVINDKFYLLSEAKKHLTTLGINISYLIWMDSGIAHLGTISKDQFINDVKTNFYDDKITIYLMKAIHSNEIKNLKSHLEYSRGKIAATLSIFPTKMIEWYCNEYYKLSDTIIDNYKLLCFEEQLMGVILAMYPIKFEFIYGDYVGLLQNLKYITTNMTTVINNLIFCRDNGINDIGYKIVLKIIESISYAKNFITYNNFLELCYNAQIVCYYIDKKISIYFGYMLGFMYYNTLDGNKFVKDKYKNIKDNLSYIGINLDIEDDFTERKIIEYDTHNILWSIM